MKRIFLMLSATVGAIFPFGKANAECVYTYSDGSTGNTFITGITTNEVCTEGNIKSETTYDLRGNRLIYSTYQDCNKACRKNYSEEYEYDSLGNEKKYNQTILHYDSIGNLSEESIGGYDIVNDQRQNVTWGYKRYDSYGNIESMDMHGYDSFGSIYYTCEEGKCYVNTYSPYDGTGLSWLNYSESGELLNGNTCYGNSGCRFTCENNVCKYKEGVNAGELVDMSLLSNYMTSPKPFCADDSYAINGEACEYCSEAEYTSSCEFDESGTKMVECKNGAYLDGDECYECWDSDAQSCHLDDDGYMRTECRDGYMTTTCEDCDDWCMDVDDCEADYGYVRGTDEAQNICFELPSDCIAVNNNGSCKTCDSAYYLNGDWCDSCPDNAASCYLDNADRMITTCENGYLEKNGECVDASDGCGSGYKDMGGFCNRVQWTPAEAAQVLTNDNNNTVTITFRK